jgi:hypothetical protein
LNAHAYTKPPPSYPDTDNIVGRRKITAEERARAFPLPFTAARDLDQEVTDEVDISFTIPYATEAYTVITTSKDDARNLFLYGSFPTREAAVEWATKHIYTRNSHWVAVPLQKPFGSAEEQEKYLAAQRATPGG